MNHIRSFATAAALPFLITPPKRPVPALLWGLLRWCLISGTALATSHETVSKEEFDDMRERLDSGEGEGSMRNIGLWRKQLWTDSIT